MYKRLVTRAVIAILIITLICLVSTFAVRGLFPLKYQSIIIKYCEEYNVNPYLALALIKAESNFVEDAVSSANAKGLMQLTDLTFEHCTKEMGLEFADNIFDPDTNIHVGVWYLSYLLERYNSNTSNAIAAYNAGASNVDKWLSNTKYSSDGQTLDNVPFGETGRHIDKISKYIKVYEFLYPTI